MVEESGSPADAGIGEEKEPFDIDEFFKDESGFTEEELTGIPEKTEEADESELAEGEKEVEENEEVGDGDDVEVFEDAGEPAPVKTPLTPEEQSLKDKYYDQKRRNDVLEGKYQALQDQINAKPVEQGDPEPELEDQLVEELGDLPAVRKLAQQNKALEDKLYQQEVRTANTGREAVENELNSFWVANSEVFNNETTKAAFLDDLDDRLGTDGFQAIVDGLKAKRGFNPAFAPVLAAKMKKALLVVAGKGRGNGKKKVDSDKRNEERKAKPPGVHPDVAANTTPAELSYSEAIRQARNT